MNEVTVYSVADYVRFVCDTRREWCLVDDQYSDPWFRGHRDCEWDLKPTLYRAGLEDDETDLRAEFQRRSGHLPLEREPRTQWEWYFLMQHYRAPTRLLDWTDSALVALFFAVTANDPIDPKVVCDAAVWVLDPWWLNMRVIGRQSLLLPDFQEARSYLPDLYGRTIRRALPAAIDPPHVARRVGVQRSHFTVFGTQADGLKRLATRRNSRLIRIRLPKSAIPYMRLDLTTCGVCDTVVFPDLEGLSRELSRFYTDAWENSLPPIDRST